MRQVNKNGEEMITVTIVKEVYDVAVAHKIAMEQELGRTVTLRDATETLILAGMDNPSVVPSKNNTVVYSKSAGWTEKEDTPEDERAGWPFMCSNEGELDIDRIMWDEDTGTWVVICK